VLKSGGALLHRIGNKREAVESRVKTCIIPHPALGGSR
jgi:hypothetical protein